MFCAPTTFPSLNREYRYTEDRFTGVLPRIFYNNFWWAKECWSLYRECRYTEDRYTGVPLYLPLFLRESTNSVKKILNMTLNVIYLNFTKYLKNGILLQGSFLRTLSYCNSIDAMLCKAKRAKVVYVGLLLQDSSIEVLNLLDDWLAMASSMFQIKQMLNHWQTSYGLFVP